MRTPFCGRFIETMMMPDGEIEYLYCTPDGYPPKDEEQITMSAYRDFVDGLFVKRRQGIEGFVHASMGLAGEAGECLDLVKKSYAYDKPLDTDKLIEEAGDAFHYLNMLCLKLGEALGKPFGIQDLIDHNVTKLRKRYPNGYSDAAAIARADKQ
jgi:NTP pyrophosphatase (non-canonical NTP hydrolase)